MGRGERKGCGGRLREERVVVWTFVFTALFLRNSSLYSTPPYTHTLGPSLRQSLMYLRSVVKLTGYDADKQEINRPSELLNNVKVCS